MDKDTELFYKKHKDLEPTFPIKPNDVDEKDGIVTSKWFLQKMIDENVGWLELDLASVNPAQYENIGLHFKGRLETDTVTHKMKTLPLGEKVSGLTMYNQKWLNIDGVDIPVTADWWFNCTAVEKLKKLNYWKIDPQGYVKPLNWNMAPTKDTIESMDVMSYPWMYMVSLVEPGADCHTVIEDCGTIPVQMGKIYFLNPRKKLCMVNTGSTPSVRMWGTVEVGNEFLRFSDLVTRSYIRSLWLKESHENTLLP